MSDDEDLWGESWDDFESFESTEAHGAPDAVEVFQNAALELIAAARNALDVAEELVADPHAIGVALESVKGIATEVLRSARPGGPPAPRPRADAADVDDFQSIRVDDDD